jgi:hypothetical protein
MLVADAAALSAPLGIGQRAAEARLGDVIDRDGKFAA